MDIYKALYLLEAQMDSGFTYFACIKCVIGYRINCSLLFTRVHIVHQGLLRVEEDFSLVFIFQDVKYNV